MTTRTDRPPANGHPETTDHQYRDGVRQRKHALSEAEAAEAEAKAEFRAARQETAKARAELYRFIDSMDEAASLFDLAEGKAAQADADWRRVEAALGGEAAAEEPLHTQPLSAEVKLPVPPLRVPAGDVGRECSCGADRTGPSAEAHDPGCPVVGAAVPPIRPRPSDYRVV